MKILVIDDAKLHREAAKALFPDHELTVVGSYDAGQQLVGQLHQFDVVLVDLLMPASAQSMGADRNLVGQEMPVGIFLALLAAKNGAQYVAVFTDQDHHSHPASACFDAFNAHETTPTPFVVEGAKVLLSNTRNWVRDFYADDLSQPLGWRSDFDPSRPRVRAKNWREVFDYLLGH